MKQIFDWSCTKNVTVTGPYFLSLDSVRKLVIYPSLSMQFTILPGISIKFAIKTGERGASLGENTPLKQGEPSRKHT